jgi:hypothetical protein
VRAEPETLAFPTRSVRNRLGRWPRPAKPEPPTSAELARRVRNSHISATLSARELERWLVANGLARIDEERRVHVTEHGRALAARVFG